MSKDGLGGERTRDLSLKVADVSSGEIGAAAAQVRATRMERKDFILLVDWGMKESEESECGAGSDASLWE